MNLNKKWGYVRVSSKDQNEERQVNEILPLVSTPSHLFVEKKSGKDFNRPKFQALKDLMDEGDTLIIKSLDRLGRNYEEIKNEWKDLTDRGIYIKILDNPLLDTSKYADNDLMAKFTANITLEVLSFVAENERVNIRKRQAEGIANAKAKGIHLGRPKATFPENWGDVYSRWKRKSITGVQAMRELNLKRTTFYKLIKIYEKRE